MPSSTFANALMYTATTAMVTAMVTGLPAAEAVRAGMSSVTRSL